MFITSACNLEGTGLSILILYLVFRGDFGRLGHGNSSDLFIPHPIKTLQGLQIKQIACGDSHCLAITTNGEVQRLFLILGLHALIFRVLFSSCSGLINSFVCKERLII